MKLSHWAKQKGISYLTALRWFHAGKIPNSVQYPSGTIIVNESQQILNENLKVVIYCRVSSNEKKDDLERQAKRCEEFCNANGWVVEKVVKEIASGMNDSRPKLTKILEGKPYHIVVEHKDRLTRFGFNYLETMLPKCGFKLTVIHRDKEEKDDLMKDLVAIITSFCCRLYGLRRGQNKKSKIVTILETNNDG